MDLEKLAVEATARVLEALARKSGPSKRVLRRRRQRTPTTCPKAIAALHEEARRISKETGIVHNLDHVVPLSKGGRHHQDNLAIVPKHLNEAKGNQLDWRPTPADMNRQPYLYRGRRKAKGAAG